MPQFQCLLFKFALKRIKILELSKDCWLLRTTFFEEMVKFLTFWPCFGIQILKLGLLRLLSSSWQIRMFLEPYYLNLFTMKLAKKF